MTKVFVLFKKQFQEGNFGDLENAPSALLGVFTSIEELNNAIEIEIY